MTDIADIPIIDVDAHVTEPADLWTSRLSSAYQDLAPRVVWRAEDKEHRWLVGDTMLQSVGAFAMGGWREPYPYSPSNFDDMDPAAFDARARLERMDEFGLEAQVLYPNLLGFDTQIFLQLGPEVALACVQAYNDFLVEWASADAKRLIPVMCLPHWDVDAALKELDRCHRAGHRGILLAANYEKIGAANIAEDVWEPVLKEAEERGLSANFHIGFNQLSAADIARLWGGRTRASMEIAPPDVLATIKVQATSFLGNAQAIVDIIVNGVCERYPRLQFVSVESGFGYVPFVLQALDWQWNNDGGSRANPKLTLLPSEYFERQIYTTFWFEQPPTEWLVRYQDRLMFETDFPHPTSLTPGPWSSAKPARETAQRALRDVAPSVARKILYDNAAHLYRVD